MNADKPADAGIIEQLYEVVEGRRGTDPEQSYTARLFHRGLPKIAQKVGEEAAETVVAALAEKRQALVAESADLLYHLVVMWAARGVRPSEVFAELAKRAEPQWKRPADKKPKG